MWINIVLLLMIAGLAVHATFTDLKRYEIENYGILFGTPIIWLAIVTGLLERTILHLSMGDTSALVVEKELTIGLSLISFLVIFIMFYIAPVGGGDMKFMAFIAAYFGIIETIIIFLFGSVLMLIIHFATAKKYMKEKPELFEGQTTFLSRTKKLMQRKVPLFAGMGPAIVIASLYYIYTYFV